MRKATRVLRMLPLLLWILTGCATLRMPSPLAGETQDVLLKDVPYIQQEENHCGPAALTMTALYAGKNVKPADLAQQLMTPQKNGTFTTDLAGAARRQGLLIVPVTSWEAMRLELKAGHPVIILQDVGLTTTQWHFAVVTGWNRESDVVYLHSGEPHRSFPAKYVQKTWEHGNHWGAVVLQPGELAASAGEAAHAASAAALESSGKWEEAETVYLAMLKQWPQSKAALLGLGNTRYHFGDVKGAIDYLEKGQRYHPEDLILKHNLAVAISTVDHKRSRRLALQVWDEANEEQRQKFRVSLHGLVDSERLGYE